MRRREASNRADSLSNQNVMLAAHSHESSTDVTKSASPTPTARPSTTHDSKVIILDSISYTVIACQIPILASSYLSDAVELALSPQFSLASCSIHPKVQSPPSRMKAKASAKYQLPLHIFTRSHMKHPRGRVTVERFWGGAYRSFNEKPNQFPISVPNTDPDLEKQ